MYCASPATEKAWRLTEIGASESGQASGHSLAASPGVVGTSSWAHHTVMNEFPGPGQQPTGNPGRRLTREERSAAIRDAQVRACEQAASADRPVRVRIVWDAGIRSPVTRGLRQDERDSFPSLVSPDPGALKVLDVQDAGFMLSKGDGFVVDSPGLPQIAVHKTADASYVLLDLAPRWADRAPGLIPAAPARPDTPVRVRLVWDAEIRSPVTRGLGKAEQDLFRALVNPDPGAREVPDVQEADFMLSTGDGFVVDSLALPHVAVGKTADAINVLLVPARPHPFPPVEKFSPVGSPVRKSASGFGPTV